MFAALLDTCALWPSRQRDFLLSLAAAGAYRPLWSEEILAELHDCEMDKLLDRGSTQADAQQDADWLLSRLREYFDEAIVEGWEPLEGTYGLPDPDDEHVLAAAVKGGAGVIVTDNVKDFPAHLLPDRITAQLPKDFAENAVSISPESGIVALHAMSDRLGATGPAMKPAAILDLLVVRYGMTGVHRELASRL